MNKKLNFWNKLKIRWKLILIILPITVIPLLLITIITSYNIYGYLEKQKKEYYSIIIKQMRDNMSYVFNQSAMTISNIFNSPNVKSTITAPQYKNINEEIKIKRQMFLDNKESSLRDMIQEKINGQVYIYEMDKKSLINKKQNYIVHKITNDNNLTIDYDKLIQDKLFKYIQKNKKRNIICGKLTKGALIGNDSNNLFALIYPYYINNDRSQEFKKFMLVLINKKTLAKFYKKNNDFNKGTLYILDNNYNIILSNHPDESDRFEFNAGKYINKYKKNMNKNGKNNFYNSFKGYTYINVDSSILHDTKGVKIINLFNGYLDSMNNKNEEEIITPQYKIKFNNKKYLTFLNFEKTSRFKFVFFYPQFYVLYPILNIIFIVGILSLISIIIIILITVIFSKILTGPIKSLVLATKKISRGNYSEFVKVKSYDEIGTLSFNFNQMIKNIKAYQDKILSMEREKSEMELATKIQTSLLPPIPNKQFYDISATMIPATEVGGDYYDLVTENNGRIWFGIGDVSGHGLSSGLIMMMAQTAFNTILLNEPKISTDKLIIDVNKVLYQNVKERLGKDDFMTLSFMVADPNGEVKFSGAHLDVLVYRDKTKKVERVKTLGIWLGILPDIEKDTLENSLKLQKGDLMFLYTDGLIEAMDADNNQYDMDRLIKKLKEIGHEPVLNIEEAIITDVFDFLEEQKDDITFVIARKVN